MAFKRILFIGLLSLVLSGIASGAHAQSYKYMDEGGNIHFVDRPQDVPYKYRNQVAAFQKPTPVLDKKAKHKKEKELAKEQKAKDKQKAKERKLREKQIKKAQSKGPKLTKAEAKKLEQEQREQQLIEDFGNTKPVAAVETPIQKQNTIPNQIQEEVPSEPIP